MAVQDVIKAAHHVFGDDYPAYPDVPIPISRNRITKLPAIWTRDGLRPRWGNLAFAAAEVNQSASQNWWEKEVARQTLPTTILANVDRYIVIERTAQGGIRTTDVTDVLPNTLQRLRDQYFSPQALSKFKQGQLSFADLEDRWSDGFASHMRREQRRLDKALYNGVKKAIQEEGSDSKQQIDKIFGVALAYMGARILEDKGYFGSNRMASNDPVELLRKTVEKTNGFFHHANGLIGTLKDSTVQALAYELGLGISFALTDHRDVGRLYEQALKTLILSSKESDEKWDDESLLGLQQYYTPVAVANQMLAHLPIERIHPKERVIYDPASGSGSLLLAASNRLSQMLDVGKLDNPSQYLAEHVLGNDVDPNARLLTNLRYFLIQESLGGIDSLLPAPTHFSKYDYTLDSSWKELPKTPRILVANPPFKQVDGKEAAAVFVSSMLDHLKDGDQFAFILPHSLFVATKLGWKQAKDALNEKSQLFETWEFPQDVVGISASVSVSVVLGMIGAKNRHWLIPRAVKSGQSAVRQKVTEEGFLGNARLVSVNGEIDWNTISAPSPKVTSSIKLKDLYFICNGARLKTGGKRYSKKDLGTLDDEDRKDAKPAWLNSWRHEGQLWANPRNAPKDEKYLVYNENHLSRMRSWAEAIYDSDKVLIGRSVNSTARDPLPAYIDLSGLCPNNHLYCAVPREELAEQSVAPKGWDKLERLDKLAWLVGILNSRLLEHLSRIGRGSRDLKKPNLENLPLPAHVDTQIIRIVNQIVDIERGLADGNIRTLKDELNEKVIKSFGSPVLPSDIDYSVISKSWECEKGENSFVSTGQVLEVNADNSSILLFLDNLDEDLDSAWLPLPQNLPAWALDGTVFDVNIPINIRSFAELAKRPWALHGFEHTPRPYLSMDELQGKLLEKLGV